ncbi:tetratricopeptide repeat protein [Paraglaciecola sp.]|uniref:tetratricopeptide repeat protein n=1 Tax=Paraglaciecola sp. TaxID=1920173 RepID=UPI003EF82F96
MWFTGKLIIRFKVYVLLLLSSAVYAHDGHNDEDIVLKDLGYLGDVNFSISCDVKSQKAMQTGVALLHHMMYAQAEMLFKKWIQKEPECGMFYWGYAMSMNHPLWPDKISKVALKNGQQALAKAQTFELTKREQSYVSAAQKFYNDWQTVPEQNRTKAWAVAHAELAKQYPNDVDATAFYALSLLVTASKKDKTFSANKKAGGILAKVLDKHSSHPGAIHYSIHAYDNPVLAELGVSPSRAYDKIAPDVPHALHMPTHVFVRIGAWQDVASWNIRSANAALKYPTNGATSMHYVHALDYLVYGYLQLGEGEKAAGVLQEFEAYHPIQNTFPAAYALSAMPARVALEQKQWKQASQLKTRTPSYISWEKFPQVEAITYFAKGIGAARSGDLAQAQKHIKVLDKLFEQTKQSSPQYWALLVDAQRKSVQAWVEFANGQHKTALKLQTQAADIEDALDKNPVTPGAVLPARDLLGDMLRLTGDQVGAKQAFKQSLAIGPKRRYSQLD